MLVYRYPRFAYFPTHPLDGRDMLEPFAALSRSAQRELKEEAGRLEAFLAD